MARDDGKDDTDGKTGDDGKKRSAKAPFGTFYGHPITFWVNSVLGKPLLLVGLVLAVLGRGCDATGMRGVARSDAAYRQATIAFDLEWQAKASDKRLAVAKKMREVEDLNEKIRDPETKPDKQTEYQKQVTDILKGLEPTNKELRTMSADRELKRAEMENKDWKSLREASLKANNSNRMMSLWYEVAFIGGTLILVLGLLIVAFTGEGAEKWIAYIMMAIITFSIYVLGAAWIESIATSASSMIPGGGAPPIQRDMDFDPPPIRKKGF